MTSVRSGKLFTANTRQFAPFGSSNCCMRISPGVGFGLVGFKIRFGGRLCCSSESTTTMATFMVEFLAHLAAGCCKRDKMRRMTSLKRFALSSLVVVAAAVTFAQGQVPRIPGIDTAGMDLSVRPQDDFFRYVNGKWVDTTEIPADQSTFGTFAMLRIESQQAVRAIIEEEGRSKAANGSLAQKVGDYYKSYMDTAQRDALGVTPLNAELAAIEEIK